MHRFLPSVALIVGLAVFVSACGKDSEVTTERSPSVETGSASDAESICEEFRPPAYPDAEVVGFMEVTVEQVNAGQRMLGRSEIDSLPGTDAAGAIARCSYVDQRRSLTPTTICPDGAAVSLAPPLQYLVAQGGVAVEDPGVGVGIDEVTC